MKNDETRHCACPPHKTPKNAGAVKIEVLVHCTEGRSRSVAILVAFLMQKEKISLGKAGFEMCRKHRWDRLTDKNHQNGGMEVVHDASSI